MTRFSLPVVVVCLLALSGCSQNALHLASSGSASLHGLVMGGQQPVTGSTIQLYAAGTGGTGTAATPLLTTTVTTSDGSGSAGNTMPAGFFTITGDYTCPTPNTQVYLVATGGNPGLSSGTNNASLAMMDALGSCGTLSSSTNVTINEVTTVGAIAALYPYMTGYANVASASTETSGLAQEFSQASVYANSGTGVAPGPSLPSGYYASSTEINTLADVIAACINSAGDGGHGSPCHVLFLETQPPATGSVAATDTIGALIDILNNPTNDVTAIFNTQTTTPPFQPTLQTAPSDWTLPIVPLPSTPYFSPAGGTYVQAQSVSLQSLTPGVTIYYTTNGSSPTTSSMQYTGAISVGATETLKAIAVNRAGSTGASASYTFTSTVAAPLFSLPAGSYSGPQTVTITPATPDAAIYYTTDGSTPTSSSTLYSAPIVVYASETVKAIAVAGSLSSSVVPAAYTITGSGNIYTFAGGGSVPNSVAATKVPVTSVTSGIAVDGNGNLYFVDTTNRIYKMSLQTGIATIFAGNGTAGFSGDGGPATSAAINEPRGMSVDASGSLYFADESNQRIRRVDATTGFITTVAGNGTPGYTGDGGSATSAELNYPLDVKLDQSGNLFISDSSNYVVRKVSGGIITTVAGSGTSGFSGDGGPATSAQIANLQEIAVDFAGDLFLADYGSNRVREVAAGTGIITTVAGNGSTAVDGDGGPPTSASTGYVTGMAVDASGNLYFGNGTLRKVAAATGVISTFSSLNGYELALDPSGNLFTLDISSKTVREFPAGSSTSFAVAGNGNTTYLGIGGPATNSVLSSPMSGVFDASGNFYFINVGVSAIEKVSATSGAVTTIASGISFSSNANSALAVDASGNVYYSLPLKEKVNKVAAGTGTVTLFAGTGTAGFSGDGGPATSAKLAHPSGLAVDTAGNVYIADNGNARVRKVDTSGTITTLSQAVEYPYGLAIDASGAVYAADYLGNKVVKISNGVASTVASINYPVYLAVDASGNLYVTSTGNTVVKIAAGTGTQSTYAGTGTAGFAGDGGAATAALLNAPKGVAVDANGRVYVADYGNARIRVVYP